MVKIIKRTIRQFLFFLLFISPLRRFVFWVEDKISQDNQVIILIYHRVYDIMGESDDPHRLKITPKNFERQMKYLAKNFPVISLEQFIEQIENGKLLKKRQVILTFDDGYRDNYQNAYPVLKKYRLPATIFLATGYTDTEPDFWPWDTDKNTIKITHDSDLPLTWQQIREMAASPLISFGAHTHSHPILSKLDDNAAKSEIMRSKREIEANLGKSVIGFAYPHGTSADFHQRTIDIVKDCGFRCACSTIGGINNLDSDFFTLKRLAPPNSTITFVAFITRYLKIRKFFSKLKQSLK